MSRGGSRTPLPKVVKQLGAVSFFNDLASEMVYPLLPALVTTRLGGTAVALGALDGIAEAMAAVAKAGSGWLSERRGLRGPLVILGYVVAAVTRPAIGLATAVWQVIGLRATDRLGKGLRNPPRDTVIADASPGDLRGRAFGFHRALDHAGAVVGPLVAWSLLTGAGLTPSGVIQWSLVPGILAVLVVIWALRRVPDPPPSPETTVRPEERASGGQRSLVFGLIVVFAFARFPETLLLLRLHDLGVAVAIAPLLWAALHVVRTVASYPGGWMSDTLGPRRAMAGGWLLYVAVCFGLATVSSPWAAAGWFLVFGLVAAATEAPERAFVAAAGRATRRGRRFGAYHAVIGLAALPGALFFGILYQAQGAEVALAVSGTPAAALSVAGFFSNRGKTGHDAS